MAGIIYSANTAITFDLSALPTSATFVLGRECTQVDNTTTLYMDAIVNVKEILGHATTAPVIGQMINLYVWGSDVSLATTPIDVLDGTDSAETLSHVAVLNSLRPAGSALVTVATAALKYTFMPFSVATQLGLICLPKFWGLYAAHNHAGALAAAQTANFTFTGITTS